MLHHHRSPLRRHHSTAATLRLALAGLASASLPLLLLLIPHTCAQRTPSASGCACTSDCYSGVVAAANWCFIDESSCTGTIPFRDQLTGRGYDACVAGATAVPYTVTAGRTALPSATSSASASASSQTGTRPTSAPKLTSTISGTRGASTSTGTGSTSPTSTSTAIASSDSSSSGLSSAAIGGIAGGGIAALILIALVGILIWRRHKARKGYQPTLTMDPSTDPETPMRIRSTPPLDRNWTTHTQSSSIVPSHANSVPGSPLIPPSPDFPTSNGQGQAFPLPYPAVTSTRSASGGDAAAAAQHAPTNPPALTASQVMAPLLPSNSVSSTNRPVPPRSRASTRRELAGTPPPARASPVLVDALPPVPPRTPTPVPTLFDPPADGRIYALEDYASHYPGDLALRAGDRVDVEQVFEDGWAWGVNSRSGGVGMFPVEFVGRRAVV
ncbi:hypothetical protein M427DRAFT_73414 [Gonapodya prolifera JEL478]|uniref:SH3 domain-containing protein n=1 Tax=Gonapodya prolifera (strain JEL478) TaxID=1344416 RepID=A0A139A2E2_GONPJ|nr:hypothetical protein M427DRAFT_73414 [Gonapodya prolifera JEL478]|eukprot:KXS10956.1 hypothetical protein M427DRAFT_73414 [Gonapodya prolifera JEL478]